MTDVRIVLASASPRRADVLRQLGLAPEVCPADVDETYFPGETPEQHVERLARAKASAVADAYTGALVVGGDTVVLDGATVMGKPRNGDDATEVLLALAGREHQVLSGLAIAGAHGIVSRVVCTRVRFRDFSADDARAYVSSGEPLDKAGSYGIQGLGAALVAGISGDYYAVVGFPVAAFIDLLTEAGWRYDFGRVVPRP
ncbi:MAG: Maf family protein [Gemmatimonadetes bacterium]|jgi:septum formation protein|nr:Maf family protein [Gemmatimonadota bacterium]